MKMLKWFAKLSSVSFTISHSLDSVTASHLTWPSTGALSWQHLLLYAYSDLIWRHIALNCILTDWLNERTTMIYSKLRQGNCASVRLCHHKLYSGLMKWLPFSDKSSSYIIMKCKEMSWIESPVIPSHIYIISF